MMLPTATLLSSSVTLPTSAIAFVNKAAAHYPDQRRITFSLSILTPQWAAGLQ